MMGMRVVALLSVLAVCAVSADTVRGGLYLSSSCDNPRYLVDLELGACEDLTGDVSVVVDTDGSGSYTVTAYDGSGCGGDAVEVREGVTCGQCYDTAHQLNSGQDVYLGLPCGSGANKSMAKNAVIGVAAAGAVGLMAASYYTFSRKRDRSSLLSKSSVPSDQYGTN